MPEAGENLKLVQKVKKCPNGEGTFGPLNGLMVPPLKKVKLIALKEMFYCSTSKELIYNSLWMREVLWIGT